MNLRHYDNDGRARFVTFCTHRKLPILTNDVFRRNVVNALETVRSQSGLKLIAYVIMPEHVHLIVIPPENSKLGAIVGEIKRLSAQDIIARLRRGNGPLLKELMVIRNRIQRYALWQRRCYDHNVRCDDSLLVKVAYCHNNPVTRGLVRNPEDWQWSSYKWYQGACAVPIEMDLMATAK